MKILILGDFSAVNYNLWRALTARGADVTFYSRGDGFKDLPSSRRFFVRQPGSSTLTGALREVGDQLITAPRLRGYDVAMLHAPFQFHNRLNRPLVRWVLAANRHVVLQHMACSGAYHSFVRELPYSPCEQCAQFDHGGVPCADPEFQQPAWEEEIYSRAGAIVCTGYEYLEAIRRKTLHADRAVPIRLPLNLDEHGFEPLATEGPVRVLYGKNRDGFKGTMYIRPALERLRETHAGRVEVTIAERMPYAQYVEVVRRAHIIVDQCNSYSYGMTALIAAARGKVVLTGAEPEALVAMGMAADAPLVNILPDADHIWRTLAGLVDEGPARLAARGEQAHAFARRYHDADAIAGEYLALFERLDHT